ncbi:hypothetical protein [Ekhidna sp.]|uniref:hypothetical protein n=1 Tax=Ekhidna sp. TaxID=2608089 RepID=UPI0032EC26E0
MDPQNLSNLIDEHREAFEFVFKAFGFRKKPTVKTVLAAYVAHGRKFADAVEAAINSIQENEAFIGKKEGWFGDFLDKAVVTLTSASAVQKAFSNKEEEESGVKVTTTQQKDNNEGNDEPEKDPDKIMGIPKMVFWGGVVTLFLITILIIIKRK